MLQFCSDGALNPNGHQATSCNDANDQEACDRLERFKSVQYNGMTGPDACCVCGGGYSPDLLPEMVVEWKIVVYGHEKSSMQGALSGVGNDVQLGRWGGRGVVYDGKRLTFPNKSEMEALKAEALSGARDMFGGLRGRN